MDKITRLILLEMKLLNIIKDDDNMEWCSPDKQFIFEIKRYDSMFSMDGSRYRIELIIKDILGVIITQISFSELDAIRILDSINVFLYDMDNQTLSDMSIYIDPNNGRLETNILYMIRDDILRSEFYNNPYYVNEMTGTYRDVKFELRKYSPYQETIIPILTFYISNEELNDFMFAIYFTCLIDIEIPTEYISSMEYIVQNLVDYGYLNGGDY